MKLTEVKALNAEIQEKHNRLLQIKEAISRLDAEPQHDEAALEQLHDIEAERQELMADAELASDDKQRAAIEKQLSELTAQAKELKQRSKAPGVKIAERKAALESRQEAIAAELAELKGQQLEVMPDALEPERLKRHGELVKAAWSLVEELGKHEAYINEKTRLGVGQYRFQSVFSDDLLSSLSKITESAARVEGHVSEVKKAYRRAEASENAAIKKQWGLV